MLDQLLPWIPSALTLAVGVIVLGAARIFSSRSDKRTSLWVQAFVITTGLVLLVAILATLPVEHSLRAQLFSLLGVVLSAAIALSSTTFIGNAMAGLMLSILRNFRPGDFVRVGEHMGRVSARGLFHTEIQTETSDLTTLPNMFLVTNAVTVVPAEASLGYDVSRHDIEACLLKAAAAAGLEEPFVQIVELGDFSVLYRVAGLLKEVKSLISSRSRLRAEMLDALHAAEIEIVSPNFMNTRALPPETRVIPTAKRGKKRPEASEGGSPESIVFDKAEAAAETEALKDEAAANEAAAEALKDQARQTEDEAQAAALAAEAERLRVEAERAEQAAAEREANPGGGPPAAR